MDIIYFPFLPAVCHFPQTSIFVSIRLCFLPADKCNEHSILLYFPTHCSPADSAFRADRSDRMKASITDDKKQSTASLGIDLKGIIQQNSSQRASRNVSLSGMSILLLPLPVAGLDMAANRSTVDMEKSVYHNIDCAILVLCSIGDCLAMIGAATSETVWNSTLHYNFKESDYLFIGEFQTTKAFNIISAFSGLCALISGILKMKIKPITEQRFFHLLFVSMLIISFFSSLISIAVWGDLIWHGQFRLGFPKWRMDPVNKISFGWAFWVMVSAASFLFLSNVCHLIRRDCKQKVDLVSKSDDDTLSIRNEIPRKK